MFGPWRRQQRRRPCGGGCARGCLGRRRRPLSRRARRLLSLRVARHAAAAADAQRRRGRHRGWSLPLAAAPRWWGRAPTAAAAAAADPGPVRSRQRLRAAPRRGLLLRGGRSPTSTPAAAVAAATAVSAVSAAAAAAGLPRSLVRLLLLFALRGAPSLLAGLGPGPGGEPIGGLPRVGQQAKPQRQGPTAARSPAYTLLKRQRRLSS